MIDWRAVIETYNERNGEKYSDIKSLIFDLYNREKSTYLVADALGVSQTTVYKILSPEIKQRDRNIFKEKFLGFVKTKGFSETLSISNKDLASTIGCSIIWIIKLKKRLKNGNI